MPLLFRYVYPSLGEWKIKFAEKGFFKFCYKSPKEVFEKAIFYYYCYYYYCCCSLFNFGQNTNK